MKRSPLKRKTPLKRSVKPLQRTKIRAVAERTKKAQSAQRRAVKKRSGGQCEFLLLQGRCSRKGVDMAHIVPRRECGKARDLPETVVHACRACHDYYDARSGYSSLLFVPRILLLGCHAAIAKANLKAPMKTSVKQRLT